MKNSEKQLAEARAEIERLKAEVDRWRKESLSKDDARLNLRSAADSIKYWTKQAFDKDKLIEQMRDALKACAEFIHYYDQEHNIGDGKVLAQAIAALSAAERGEG